MILEIASLISVLAAGACHNVFLTSISNKISSIPTAISLPNFVFSILFDICLAFELAFAVLQIVFGRHDVFAMKWRSIVGNIALFFMNALVAVWSWLFSVNSIDYIIIIGISAAMTLLGIISYACLDSSNGPRHRRRLKKLSKRQYYAFRYWLFAGMMSPIISWNVFALQMSVAMMLQTSAPPNCTFTTLLMVAPPAIIGALCIIKNNILCLAVPLAFTLAQFFTTKPATVSCSESLESISLTTTFALGFELIGVVILFVVKVLKVSNKHHKHRHSSNKQEDVEAAITKEYNLDQTLRMPEEYVNDKFRFPLFNVNEEGADDNCTSDKISTSLQVKQVTQ